MNKIIRKATAVIAATVILITMFAGAFTVSAVNTDVYTAFEEHTFEGEIKLGYRLHIPENYDETKEYPVVVFLHGLDARGSDNTSQLSVFIDDLFASETSELHDAIVIAPQCPPNKRWVDAVGVDGCYSTDELPETDQLKTVIQLIEYIKETYSADNDRVYAMGLSMGGYGTWDLITRHPSVFAAALPICGAGDPTKAEILSKIPIWTLHGNKDKIVDFETSTPVMVKAIRKFADNRLKYSELDGVGHEAWEYVEKHPEYITWLFSQKYDRDDSDHPCATHTYGEEGTVEKTCNSGYTYRVCSKCGYVKKYNYDYSSHTYRSVVTPATCTTGGYTTNTCTVCGYVMVNNKVNPLDHNYVAVTTPKTCTTDGSIKYTCSRCGGSYSVPIPASHNVGEWEIISEPSYSEAGQRRGSCKDCSESVIQWILPLKEGAAYDWNYADESAGEADVAATLENSAVIPGTSADKITYKTAGYLEIPAKPEYTTVLFNTPTGFEPYKFTMTAPNNAGGSNGNSAGAGAAVIGNITYGSGDSAVTKSCFVWVVSESESNGFRGAYLIMQDQSGKILLRKPLNLAKNGVYTGSNQYRNAMDVPDIGASGVASLTHTYTITANGSSVTVAVNSAYYNKSKKETYYADAEPITITEDDFANIDSNITSFIPMFGLARSYWGIGNYNFTSRYYSAKSEYIKCANEICKHQNTKTIAEIPATCTATGKTAEVICADCGTHISGGETIGALGHDYIENRTEATCTAAGRIVTTCSRCDYENEAVIPAAGHKCGNVTVIKPVTCTTDGEQTGICSACGQTVTETVPATGHSWSEWEIVTPATETSAGLKKRVCAACSKEETEIIPIIRNDVVYDWTYTDTSTAGANAVADTLDKSTVTADVITHAVAKQFSNGQQQVNSVGNNIGFLSMSDETVAVFNTPDGYKPSEFTLVAPNYTSTGNKHVATGAPVIGSVSKADGENVVYSVYVASVRDNANDHTRCELVLQGSDGTSKVIAMNLTNPDNGNTGNTYNAVKGGYLDGLFRNNLTYTYNVVPGDASVTVNISIQYDRPTANPAEVYTFIADPIVINAADLADGSFTPAFGIASGMLNNSTAKLAAKVYSAKAVYKNGDAPEECEHKNTKTIAEIPATCTTAGKTAEVVCADCGAHISGGETTNALGHDYQTATVESTCTVKGSTTTTCSRCDYKDVKELPLKDHTAAAERKGFKAATCTEDGYTGDAICKDCGAVIETGKATTALGHDYQTVTVESTCTVKGSTTTTCSRCDYKDVKELPLKDHTAAAERKDVKAATCTAEGYTGDVVCKDCGTVIEAGKTVAKADHTPSDWIIDTPATSTSDGSKHTECTVCGTVLETEVIPATGEYGDVNGDGKIDSDDAILVLKYDAKSAELTDAQFALADVSGDGAVTSSDAILLLQYNAKVITEFPVNKK